jgi:taurine dioxygenase
VLEELPDRLQPVTRERGVHEVRWRYKVQPGDVDKSIAEIMDDFGAETPPVSHPIVITHPVNGRRLLYVSRGFTVALEGQHDYTEGLATLEPLFDFVERPEHVHKHPWRVGDTLLWDNRQLIHMASDTPPGQPSTSFRISLDDGLPFYVDDEPRQLPHGTLPLPR